MCKYVKLNMFVITYINLYESCKQNGAECGDKEEEKTPRFLFFFFSSMTH